jgi:hypothetical protein
MKDPNRVTSDWPVWITVLILLIGGLALQKFVLGQTSAIEWEQSQLRIPADWTLIEQDAEHIAAADFRGSGPFGPRVSLHKLEKQRLLPHGGGLWEAAVNWSTLKAQTHPGYRILRMTPVTVRNKEGVELHSAYLLEAGVNEMPGLMLAREVIVPEQNHFYIWIFAAEEDSFFSTAGLQNRVFNSWRLKSNEESAP